MPTCTGSVTFYYIGWLVLTIHTYIKLLLCILKLQRKNNPLKITTTEEKHYKNNQIREQLLKSMILIRLFNNCSLIEIF